MRMPCTAPPPRRPSMASSAGCPSMRAPNRSSSSARSVSRRCAGYATGRCATQSLPLSAWARPRLWAISRQPGTRHLGEPLAFLTPAGAAARAPAPRNVAFHAVITRSKYKRAAPKSFRSSASFRNTAQPQPSRCRIVTAPATIRSYGVRNRRGKRPKVPVGGCGRPGKFW